MPAQAVDLVAEQGPDLDPPLPDVGPESVDCLLRPVRHEVFERPGPLQRVAVLRLLGPVARLVAESQHVVVELRIEVQHVLDRVGVAQVVVRDRHEVDRPVLARPPIHLPNVRVRPIRLQHELRGCRFSHIGHWNANRGLSLLDRSQSHGPAHRTNLDLKIRLHRRAGVLDDNLHDLREPFSVTGKQHRGRDLQGAYHAPSDPGSAGTYSKQKGCENRARRHARPVSLDPCSCMNVAHGRPLRIYYFLFGVYYLQVAEALPEIIVALGRE